MALQKIYIARDGLEAHFVRNALRSEGVEAVVMGESLAPARGDLPLTPETLPSVWINAEDLERAQPILAEFSKKPVPPTTDEPAAAAWKCPQCGEEVEGLFTQCWNCQAPRPPQKQC